MSKRKFIQGVKSGYSTALKVRVVREILSGQLTVAQAVDRYEITCKGTIYQWLKNDTLRAKLVPMSEEEKEQIQALRQRIKELKGALQDANMKNAGLETMIDKAEEELDIEIRKKSGAKQSKR